MRTMQARMFGGVAGAALLLCTTGAQAVVEINVGSASGAPDATVQIQVSLNSDGNDVAATANDIIFDPAIVSATAISACVINPAISDRAPGCEDDPTSGPCKTLNRNLGDCPAAIGCPAGSEGKKRFRALVFTTTNTTLIPDGLLYTCTFKIAAGATGTTVLQNINIGASDPEGSPYEDAIGTDGAVTVEEASPTPTATPIPTDTATPLPTNTPLPTSTLPPVTPTNTPSAGSDDDDGCQIVASEHSNPGWMLLFPAAALVFLRRRGR